MRWGIFKMSNHKCPRVQRVSIRSRSRTLDHEHDDQVATQTAGGAGIMNEVKANLINAFGSRQFFTSSVSSSTTTPDTPSCRAEHLMINDASASQLFTAHSRGNRIRIRVVRVSLRTERFFAVSASSVVAQFLHAGHVEHVLL